MAGKSDADSGKKPSKASVKREKKKPEAKETPKPLKTFTIPLKKAFDKTRKKRVPYSVRLVRDFLAMHLKSGEIKLGRRLNEKLWENSIQHPPRRIKVWVFRSGNGYGAELEGFAYEEFKAKAAKKPEGLAEKLTSRLGGKALKNQEEEKIAEGKPEIREEKKPAKTPNMESK